MCPYVRNTRYNFMVLYSCSWRVIPTRNFPETREKPINDCERAERASRNCCTFASETYLVLLCASVQYEVQIGPPCQFIVLLCWRFFSHFFCFLACLSIRRWDIVHLLYKVMVIISSFFPGGGGAVCPPLPPRRYATVTNVNNKINNY